MALNYLLIPFCRINRTILSLLVALFISAYELTILSKKTESCIESASKIAFINIAD